MGLYKCVYVGRPFLGSLLMMLFIIIIASVDGLVGFKDVIKAVFPLAEVQRCIVH